MMINGPIRNQIFMGNGDHSLAYVGHLYRQLGRAIDILGGIQQHPMCTDSKEVLEQHDIDVEDGEIELEQIAKEICVALTGKKVTFIEKEDFK